MKLTMEIKDGHGRRYNSLEEAAQSIVEANISDRLGRAEGALGTLVCPEHGKSASNIRRQRVGNDEWTVSFTPCCEAAGDVGRAAVLKAMAG